MGQSEGAAPADRPENMNAPLILQAPPADSHQATPYGGETMGEVSTPHHTGHGSTVEARTRLRREQWVRDIPRRRRVSTELEAILARLYPKTAPRPPVLPETTRRALANHYAVRHGWQTWESAHRFNVQPKRPAVGVMA